MSGLGGACGRGGMTTDRNRFEPSAALKGRDNYAEMQNHDLPPGWASKHPDNSAKAKRENRIMAAVAIVLVLLILVGWWR